MKYFLKEITCEQNYSPNKKQESETLVFKWWALEDCLARSRLTGTTVFLLVSSRLLQ